MEGLDDTLRSRQLHSKRSLDEAQRRKECLCARTTGLESPRDLRRAGGDLANQRTANAMPSVRLGYNEHGQIAIAEPVSDAA